jgi:hypothetical protein
MFTTGTQMHRFRWGLYSSSAVLVEQQRTHACACGRQQAAPGSKKACSPRAVRSEHLSWEYLCGNFHISQCWLIFFLLLNLYKPNNICLGKSVTISFQFWLYYNMKI